MSKVAVSLLLLLASAGSLRIADAQVEDDCVGDDPKPASLPVRLYCPEEGEGFDVSCKVCPDKLHPEPTDCSDQLAVKGIVEVEIDGVWRLVSAEGWDEREAMVVCGELGYPISFPQGANPPNLCDIIVADSSSVSGSGESGSSPGEDCSRELEILEELLSYPCQNILRGVECSGTESSLLNCSFSGTSCLEDSTAVATVQCGYLPHSDCCLSHSDCCLPLSDCNLTTSENVRLRAGAVPWAGRVEVYMKGETELGTEETEWGTVCETGFSYIDGNVVCRSLGYGTVRSIRRYGAGIGPIHIEELDCTGSEEDILCCEHSDQPACTHLIDIGVECNAPDTSQCSQSVLHNVKMREVNSSDSSVIHTYPEILNWIGWGLICYRADRPMVTTAVGEVICRQTREQFLKSVYVGNGPPGVWGPFYDGTIDCTGDELSLSQCNLSIVAWGWCPQGYTIVECCPKAPDLVADVEWMQRSLGTIPVNYIDDVPTAHLSCAQSENCLSDQASGPNGRSLLRFDSLTWNYGLRDFRPLVPQSQWQWHRCHQHFHSVENFVEYDLLNSTTYKKVAEGHKASFCLEDSLCTQGYSYRHYYCAFRYQGISTNCGDWYYKGLDCQWIDITGVPEGQYILRQKLNPERLAVESDYRNNMAYCRIDIGIVGQFYYYTTHDCWLSDHENTPACPSDVRLDDP